MYVSICVGIAYSMFLHVAIPFWSSPLVLYTSTLGHLSVLTFLGHFFLPPFALMIFNILTISEKIEKYFLNLQTSKFALLGMRAQVVSLAVHNIASIGLLNGGRQFGFLTNYMYSSHLIYIISPFFLTFWTGIVCFKRPIRIDYGEIQIIVLIYIITNELIRPFSNFTIHATHFVMFIHIIEMEIFRKQKKFSMNWGVINNHTLISMVRDEQIDDLWKLLDITVHAVF